MIISTEKIPLSQSRVKTNSAFKLPRLEEKSEDGFSLKLENLKRKPQTFSPWKFITAILVIVAGAASFYGGMQYQKTQRGNFVGFNGQNPQGGMMRRGTQNGQNFRPVRGTILSSDDKSVTVKLADGSSKIVILAGTTSITEATSASKQALTAGTQVTVLGTDNSDGSVTAQNIQLNPTSPASR